jgi:exopolysaccharide biosynthesis operon protein EpsL
MLPLLQSSPANADSEDALNISAKYSVQTESNLFRLSSADIRSGTPANQLKTERIDTGSVSMVFDKSYSLQRFQLSGSFVDYQYKTYSYLSFNAANYAAAWNWSATPWLHGTLSSSQQQGLNNFADYRDSRERNIRTTKTTQFDAEGNLGAAWRLLAAVEQSSRSNDLPVAQEGDDRAHNYSLGLRYIYPSGTTFSYRMRNSEGDYLNRVQTVQSVLPSHYDEKMHEFRGSLPLTGKSTLQMRVAHIERTHPLLTIRNYGGPVGDITFNWLPSGKLSLSTSIGRTLAPYQTDTSSYVNRDNFSVNPAWQLTAHTSLRATYTRTNEQYVGALPGQAAAVERQDKFEAIQIGLDWRPRPTMALSFSIQNLNNQSNTTGYDYKANGATVSGQITF